MSNKDPNRLLREDEAAEFLNYSVRTLQGWRRIGKGPKFKRLGRSIRYRYKDLQDWSEGNNK